MNKPLITWLKLVAGLVILPILIFYAGISYLSGLNQQLKLRALEVAAQETLEAMRMAAATENHICRTLRDIFEDNNDAQTLVDDVQRFFADYDLQANFLVWNEGEVFEADFDYANWPGNWKDGFFQLQDFVAKRYSAEDYIPQDVYKNMRDLFGPHFFPRYYHMAIGERRLFLLRTDSGKNYPLAWVNVKDNIGLAAFFPHDIPDSFPGAVRMVNNWNNDDYALGFIHENSAHISDPDLMPLLSDRLEIIKSGYEQLYSLPDHYLVTSHIKDSLNGFCLIKKTSASGQRLSTAMASVLLILALVLCVFLYLSYQGMVRGRRIYIGIRYQLTGLFLVSVSLPGFVLFVLASDYLLQYRAGLLTNAFNSGMTYLQSVDELFESEFTAQKDILTKSVGQLKADLANKLPDRQSIVRFINAQNPEPYRFFLVASDSNLVAGERGIMKGSRVIDSWRGNLQRSRIRTNAMQAVYTLCSYVLAILNKQTIPVKMGTEAEYIAASLFQMEPAELIRMFLEEGTFWDWGIGTSRHPVYVDIIQLTSPDIWDYLLIYLYNRGDLEKAFCQRIFSNLNRNDLGMQVMTFSDGFDLVLPEKAGNIPGIIDFARQLRDRTLTRPEFIEIDGVKNMLLGHKCVIMQRIRLLGLLPLESIERQVAARRNLLLLMGFTSLLISVSLGLFVANSFTEPLQELSKGVEAIDKRQFSYRLPHLGADEFGQLAQIFNNAIVDLEEMHTASRVQKKLLDEPCAVVEFADMELFATITSFSPFGGDFYELTDLNDQMKVVIIGDVAGIGVASSLVLAFVKSALLQLRHYYLAPEKLVGYLERLMIKSGKSGGQHSIIALQALVIAAGGEIEMLNAGMMYPLVLDAEGQIKEISSGWQLLGISEKRRRQSVKIQLLPGESLVSLSGGFLAEGRVSFDELKVLLKQSRCVEIEKFCQNFTRFFVDKYGDSLTDSDLTINIIKRT